MINKLKIISFLAISCLFLLFIMQSQEGLEYKRQELSENINIKNNQKLIAALQSDLKQNSLYQKYKEIVSDEKQTKYPFGAISVEWNEKIPNGTKAEIYLRFKQDKEWSNWDLVVKDEDEKFGDNQEDGTGKAFMLINSSSAFQYKIKLFSDDGTKTASVEKIKFTYFNSKSKTSIFKRKILSSLSLFFDDKSKIISRSQWGANEDLRMYKGDIEEAKPIDFLYQSDTDFYEKYKEELGIMKIIQTDSYSNYFTWPLEYTKDIKKIIVHHTATSKELEDPAQAIRNIYHYHTITKGWGDIGYNYIIDAQGNIYEGRFGGEKVVAAHARRFNHGTIGIAVLGDFENNQIPLPALKSLIHLIEEKVEKYNIEPQGYSTMRDINLPNIIGHQDVGQTNCPGSRIYEQLAYIRSLLQYKELESLDKNENYSFLDIEDRSIIELKPDSKHQFSLKLKNTGSKTWNSKTKLVLSQTVNQDPVIEFTNSENSILAYMEEDTVKKGDVATFNIELNSSLKSGLFNYEVHPEFNNSYESSSKIILPFYIKQPILKYELVKQSKIAKKIEKKQTISLNLKIKNNGDISWYKSGDHPLVLSFDTKSEELKDFNVELKNKIVKPGKTAEFAISFKAPSSPGSHSFTIRPNIEGVASLEGETINYSFDISGTSYKFDYLGSVTDPVFTPGQSLDAKISIKNSGDVRWKARGPGLFKLKVLRNSKIKTPSLVLLNKDLSGGKEAEISFPLTAPREIGTYRIYFWPYVDNRRLSRKPISFKFNVVSEKDLSASTHLGGLIRILISYDGNPQITANGDFSLYSNDEEIRQFTMDDVLSVEYSENTYLVKNKDLALKLKDPPKFVPENRKVIMQIKNFDRRPSWNPDLVDNKFRGNLEVRYLDEKINVINELPLEDYMAGIGELPNDAHPEKQKALAIAARSYAKYHRDNNTKFPEKPYDCTDDPNVCQKYIGYSVEIRIPQMVSAVKSTSGKIVTYKSKPVLTPYFSQSDGRTRSAEEIFGWTDTPYLISVSDPYCDGLELKGHGVGLSGYGSEKAAQDGKKYDQILKYYYSGIEIEKKY